jgi:hypothetical protein
MKNAKEILEGKIYGGRPIRKPNDGWTEAVTTVVRKLLGTAGWKGFALGRKILGRKTEESMVRKWAAKP